MVTCLGGRLEVRWLTKLRKFLSVLVVMNCLTQIINQVLHKTSEQSFSRALKTGHPEGMFSHKI